MSEWRCVGMALCRNDVVSEWRCVEMALCWNGVVSEWRCVGMALCRNGVVSEWRCVKMMICCVTICRVPLFTVTNRLTILSAVVDETEVSP